MRNEETEREKEKESSSTSLGFSKQSYPHNGYNKNITRKILNFKIEGERVTLSLVYEGSQEENVSDTQILDRFFFL